MLVGLERSFDLASGHGIWNPPIMLILGEVDPRFVRDVTD